jgi:hypothetical protein
MKSEMENKDWLNDYTLLKQVSRSTPFTVPAGYFDELGDRIVSLKNLDELKNNGPDGGFTVPENYLDDLTANIRSRIVIEEALDTKDTGFTIPEGYFDSLGGHIMSRINIEEALGDPAGQFSLPDGYFDKLNQSILNKTVNLNKPESPAADSRSGIVRRMLASAAFRYATAACLAIVLGGAILLSELNNNPEAEHKRSFLHKELSNVPIDEIKSYLQLNVDAGETQQTVVAEEPPADDATLQNALQNYVDSAQ